MYSKPMFGPSSVQHPQHRSLMNPLGDLKFQNNEQQFSVESMAKFAELENKYTIPLSTKQYTNIHTDLVDYSTLYDYVSSLIVNTHSPTTKMLLKISQQGLAGAIHAFHLNSTNIAANLEKEVFKERLETMMYDKHSKTVYDTTEKQVQLFKTFTLAPLYSYYILLYGIPTQGFEPDKINKILAFMNRYNIDPYN